MVDRRKTFIVLPADYISNLNHLIKRNHKGPALQGKLMQDAPFLMMVWNSCQASIAVLLSVCESFLFTAFRYIFQFLQTFS